MMCRQKEEMRLVQLKAAMQRAAVQESGSVRHQKAER